MSLRQFLSAIAEKLRIDPLAGKEAAIAKLNPEKIYLENVRSALGVSTLQAKLYCDTAVRRGVFRKRVEVVCPDGSVAISASDEAELPELVTCWQEDGGGFTQVEYATRNLRKVSFYQMNYDDSASRAHA